MASADPGWELYRSFLSVMQEGSLSAAARALGLTQPTLGRHIEKLEEVLQVALFVRSQAGLQPTGAARALRPHAEAMASAAEALIRAASGEAEEARGTVRVTASDVVGAEVLPSIFATLRERHPGIAIELHLSNRSEDLLRHAADIAVRMVKPTQSALVTRHLGSVELRFFAHRRYLDAHGAPTSVEAIRRHALIGFDRQPSVSRLPRVGGVALTSELFAFRTDSDLAQLAALRAGVGIGACQVPLARRDKNLRPVLPEAFHFDLPVWLVMHEDLRATLRMRLVFDHLAEGLGAYLDEGR